MEQNTICRCILGKFEENTENEFDNKREDIVLQLKNGMYKTVVQELSKSLIAKIMIETKGISCTKEECANILEIYQSLLEDIADFSKTSQEIESRHQNKIRKLIEKKLKNNSHVNCGYSPQTQFNIYELALEDIKAPVLEIGCGKDAIFSRYLYENNIDAYGIDIECEDTNYSEKEDWMSKEYEENYYATIISTLAFTKEFIAAHASDTQDYLEYATTYMKILNSLKKGGKWYYIPSVPFMEELLPEDRFEVRNYFDKDNNMRTVIKRLQ